MKRTSITQYIWFGTCLRFLQDVKEGFQIHGDGWVLDNLRRFIEHLDSLDLRITKRACRYPEINLSEIISKLSKKKKDAELSKEEAQELSDAMTSLRTTYEAEASELEAFVVTPKRLDTDKLLSDVPSLFSPNVFEALPDIAQYDFKEAGKCIAFERSTATAFHILRGTESVLRVFYCTLIRSKRVYPLLWGDMVSDLKTRKKTQRYKMLCNNLDNIRFHYRNPTQHPEKIYDIDEVQDLWPLCIEVVNRMIKILQR